MLSIKRLPFSLNLILIVLFVITAGCQARITPTAAASSTPRTEVFLPLKNAPACGFAEQTKAMRPETIPDWGKLGISTCYQINLKLDGSSLYSGNEKITYQNLTGSDLSEIVLRLYPNAPVLFGGSLEITNALVNGENIVPELFLSDKTAARFRLAQPLKAGASIVLDLDFDGRLPTDFGSNDVYGIFNYSSQGPVLTMADWYPILAQRNKQGWVTQPVSIIGDAVVSETSLYGVRITFPAGWKIAATGTQVSASGSEADIVSGPVREFMIAASPAFVNYQGQYQNIKINAWGLRADQSSEQKVMDIAQNALSLFSDRFGPYPFQELDIVSVNLQRALGVEYPGLVLISSNLYNTSTAPQNLPLVVSHEVSHQWWYSVIGSDVLNNPWQDEGMASFSELLYFEKYDPAYYQGTLDYFYQSDSRYEANNPKAPIAQPVTAFTNNEKAYSILVYQKAALALDALRKQIGDPAFFKALQTYYAQYQYQLITPDKLLNAFKTACGCDLDNFYKEWGLEN